MTSRSPFQPKTFYDSMIYLYMFIWLIFYYFLVNGAMRQSSIQLLTFTKLVKISILTNSSFPLNLSENDQTPEIPQVRKKGRQKGKHRNTTCCFLLQKNQGKKKTPMLIDSGSFFVRSHL